MSQPTANQAWVLIGTLVVLILCGFGLVLIDPPLLSESLLTLVEPTTTTEPTVLSSSPLSAQFHRVMNVVDGDTIKVDIDGTIETIRLVGINTPETVDPRKPVECLGKEASDFAKQLLENTSVRLESDVTQSDRDRYGRLLRFVFLPEGTDVGKLLISEGLAQESLYSSEPHQYRAEYLAEQQQAQTMQKGMWNPSTCRDPAIQ